MKHLVTSFALALLTLQACKQNASDGSAGKTENAM